MKTLVLCLVLIAVPLSGWAEETWKPSTSLVACCMEDDIIIPCVPCEEPVKKSKRPVDKNITADRLVSGLKPYRQQLIEKCDEYLRKSEMYEYEVKAKVQYAEIAQAYCLRASLEKE